MDLWRIAVRAIAAYAYLLASTRASGKRTINQATPFDFVVALIIGDLIDDALWAEVSLAKFGAASASIFVCDAITKWAAFHSPWVFRLVDGKSRAVLRDGHKDRHELRAEQLNENDLEHELRLCGIPREKWKDVHLALLDRGHELSVLLRPGAEPAQKQHAKLAKELLAK